MGLELLTNPSVLVRAGWTKSRSVEALKPVRASSCTSAPRAPAA